MTTHKELQDRQKQLDIDKAAAKKDAIADINEKIEFYGITSKDLKLPDNLKPEHKTEPKKSKGKLPPLYRDPLTGKEWSGHGRQPDWIKDKDVTEFLINKP